MIIASGEDVLKTLAGWPRCPECGAWMEANPGGVFSEPSWSHTHSDGPCVYRWTENRGWEEDRTGRTREPQEDDCVPIPEVPTPALRPRAALRLTLLQEATNGLELAREDEDLEQLGWPRCPECGMWMEATVASWDCKCFGAEYPVSVTIYLDSDLGWRVLSGGVASNVVDAPKLTPQEAVELS